MSSHRTIRRRQRRKRSLQLRSNRWRQLCIGELLESRTPPGSMLVDALFVTGHAATVAQLAMMGNNTSREPSMAARARHEQGREECRRTPCVE